MKQAHDTVNRLNAIPKWSNAVLHLILGFTAFTCIVPLLLILSVSLTDERSVNLNGFRFWPDSFSLESYRYIFAYGYSVANAYAISVFVTVTGTFLCVLLSAMYAYSISRSSFRFKKLFSFIAVFTLLYNGGLISFYIVCTRLFDMHNQLYALILPYVVNAFNILIFRTYFLTNIHESVIEAAKIDGASEYSVFFRIVLRMSLPVLATVGLLTSITYWNDWMLSLLFIDKPGMFPLQYLLMRIENSVTAIQSVAGAAGASYAQSQLDKLPVESARMAMVIIAVGPIALAYPFFQRFFIKGLNLGAVKG